MTYDYPTAHIGWRISEDRYEQVHLERIVPDPSNKPYGYRLKYIGDYRTCAKAESAADDIEWQEFPLDALREEELAA